MAAKFQVINGEAVPDVTRNHPTRLYQSRKAVQSVGRDDMMYVLDEVAVKLVKCGRCENLFEKPELCTVGAKQVCAECKSEEADDQVFDAERSPATWAELYMLSAAGGSR